MNRPPQSRDDHGIDPREWQAQEAARDAARTGAAPQDVDADALAYAHIARALRTPPADRLPSHFAFQVAQLAARLPRAARLDLRLEQWLVRALVAAMAMGGLATAAVFGGGLWRALAASGHGAAGWTLLVAACVLPTLGMEAWRALRGDAAGAR